MGVPDEDTPDNEAPKIRRGRPGYVEHPVHVRRAALKAYAAGDNMSDFAKRFKLNKTTPLGWAKAAEVFRGTPLTEADLDAKMDAWAARLAEAHADEEKVSQRQKTIRRTKNLRKFGASAEDKSIALSLFKDLGDPDDAKAAFDLYFAQIAARMEKESTMEGQINAITAAIIIVRMRAAIESAPQINTWPDFKIAYGMLREAMGMNVEGESAGKVYDLEIVNAKPSKPVKRKKPA